ncbi:MAG: right-handed parallel beta-helix repeat-containing protein, partial [Gemmatimonadota bacterium]|nr:right-handed parallel beta-helix repeat-containing protein [Gemmatimonadota bacterium]
RRQRLPASNPSIPMPSTRPTPAIAALIILLALPACAPRYPGRRVATSGRDTGDCLVRPCRTIGYAVRQAKAGDTVSVDSGTYREAVTVAKRLTLVGHHATVDAAGQSSPANGFFIRGAGAAGTSVSGFTVRNAGLEGIFVLRTSNVTIEHDTVVGNDAYGTSNPLCTKHQSDCGEAIHLQTVTGSSVRANEVRGNLGGVLLTDEDGPTHDNVIADNAVIDNAKDCGVTLASHWLDTTSRRPAGPEIAGVYKNTVVHNTVSGSGGVGIGIFASGPGAASWGNVVEGNTVTRSVMSGLAIHSHTPAQNVDGNILRNNVLTDNGIDVENPEDKGPTGISLFSAAVPIRGTVITGNRISRQRLGIVAVRADSIPNLASNPMDSTVAQRTVLLHPGSGKTSH